MTQMQGRVALITGAAKGIGRACALAFAESGASVLVSDRNPDQVAELAATIEEMGGVAAALGCDICSEAQVEALVAEATRRWGRLDFAINNAGTSPPITPLTRCETGDWDRIIATNLTGLFYCLRAQIKTMRATGGAIVNIASTTGLRGAAGLASYSASKHGAIGLTRSAALETAAQGIRINALCPGAIETPLFAARLGDEGMRAAIAGQTPMGRIGRPEEVAALALWLCSDAAAFVTGTEFTVDGGLLAK